MNRKLLSMTVAGLFVLIGGCDRQGRPSEPARPAYQQEQLPPDAMTIKAIIFQQPAHEVKIVVDVEIENGTKDRLHLACWPIVSGDSRVFFNVERDSDIGRRFSQILADGQKHRMSLGVTYNKDAGTFGLVKIY